MGTAHRTPKKFEPVGPFEPPLPDDAMKAEGGSAEPMAVARDKGHVDESFHPTTQDRDQMARDVQQRWRDPNLDKEGLRQDRGGREEDRRVQHEAPGYKRAGQGNVELDEEAQE